MSCLLLCCVVCCCLVCWCSLSYVVFVVVLLCFLLLLLCVVVSVVVFVVAGFCVVWLLFLVLCLFTKQLIPSGYAVKRQPHGLPALAFMIFHATSHSAQHFEASEWQKPKHNAQAGQLFNGMCKIRALYIAQASQRKTSAQHFVGAPKKPH